jgi:hypothetical protein
MTRIADTQQKHGQERHLMIFTLRLSFICRSRTNEGHPYQSLDSVMAEGETVRAIYKKIE